MNGYFESENPGEWSGRKRSSPIPHGEFKLPSGRAANPKQLADDQHSGEGGERVRRRWERLPIAIPIFVRGSDESGRRFVEFATATNINAGGMSVLSRRALQPGLMVTLEIPTPTPLFQIPGHDSKIALSARVLYEECSQGFHQSGLELCSPLLPDPNP
jgi:PilZ domain